MSFFNPTYKPFGKKAILIEWPNKISESILYDILRFKENIRTSYNNFKDITTAYNTLTVNLNNIDLMIDIEIVKLKKIYKNNTVIKSLKNYLWHIPVCYNSALAVDLENVLEIKNMSLKKLIKRHSEPIYTVYFLGFLPGFPYLGGLPNILHMPRKAMPKNSVTQGSVGIGGQQTGIYTTDSPGGWHIIGKTPLLFFDANKKEPCLLKAGDKIKFESVSKEQFLTIKEQVKRGIYNIKKEIL